MQSARRGLSPRAHKCSLKRPEHSGESKGFPLKLKCPRVKQTTSMSYDFKPYPLQRVIPVPDGLRVDEITERHEAARQFKDLQVLIRNVSPWPLPPRPYKTLWDTSQHYKQAYAAQNSVDWAQQLARLEKRPIETRRQNM